MRVGVPKEIKNHECRVGLVPGSVREYVQHGHDVIIQTGAGAGIKASDEDYIAAGAKIAPDAETIFQQADMVVKVKEPQPNEWTQLREGQILYTYLHLAPDPEQTRGLVDSGVTAIAYATVTDGLGGLPLLAPMSEVAGRMSIQAGAHALEKAQGGRGTLLGGVPGVQPGKVVIIGGGVSGTHAAKMAVGMGADVTILERYLPRLRQLDDVFRGTVKTAYSNQHNLEALAVEADLVVGAVLIPGAAAPKLINRDLLKKMHNGSVFVDIAIDQGGCAETSHATTHAEPTYVEEGVVHYCVANMPGGVARTSTFALNNATLPFTLALADKGWRQACLEDPHLRAGLNVHAGRVTYKAVADDLGYDLLPADEVIAA